MLTATNAKHQHEWYKLEPGDWRCRGCNGTRRMAPVRHYNPLVLPPVHGQNPEDRILQHLLEARPKTKKLLGFE